MVEIVPMMLALVVQVDLVLVVRVVEQTELQLLVLPIEVVAVVVLVLDHLITVERLVDLV